MSTKEISVEEILRLQLQTKAWEMEQQHLNPYHVPDIAHNFTNVLIYFSQQLSEIRIFTSYQSSERLRDSKPLVQGLRDIMWQSQESI